MATWTYTDARKRFEDVVDEARVNGPQIITVRGKERAAVISHEDHVRLMALKAAAANSTEAVVSEDSSVV